MLLIARLKQKFFLLSLKNLSMRSMFSLTFCFVGTAWWNEEKWEVIVLLKTPRNLGIDFFFFGGGVVKYEVDATLKSWDRRTVEDLLWNRISLRSAIEVSERADGTLHGAYIRLIECNPEHCHNLTTRWCENISSTWEPKALKSRPQFFPDCG